MRILVLGGTSFVGRAIVADALGAGAEVTIFGRGKTGAGLFPQVPRRTGDRDIGGRVALPGLPEQPVQVVDARDLARLVVQLLADDRPGAFHAVGPAEPTTMAGLIATCAQVAGSEVDVIPVPADAVPPFFPLIRPRSAWPSQQRSPARARAAGLPATPLAVTAADVLAWDRSRGEPPLGHGLSPEEEAKLLAQA
jgi:2'-hydroxyisoflavone reductase